MRTLIPGALALMLSGMAAAGVAMAASPGDLNETYDFYLGGVRAGELEIAAKVDDGAYSARSVLRTAGIVGMVYKASFEAETEGTVGATRLSPARFQANSRMRSKRQFVEMHYAGNAPSTVAAEPAFTPKPYQVDPTLQTGAFDPITAALTALAPAPAGQVCNTVVDVFDGRRRYTIELGAPEADGARIRCDAVYRRVAGFKPKMMKKQSEFPFKVWFEPRGDGLAQIVRAAGGTTFGLAVILLRD